MSPSDYRYCSFCHCITNMPINAYQLGSKQLSIRLLCLSVSANTFTDIYRVGIFYQVTSLLIFVNPPYENCFMISVVYLSYSSLATLKPFFNNITIDAKLTTKMRCCEMREPWRLWKDFYVRLATSNSWRRKKLCWWNDNAISFLKNSSAVN